MNLLGSDAVPQIKANLIEKYVPTPINLAGMTGSIDLSRRANQLSVHFTACLSAAAA
jgi:hypothetical protein